MENVKGFDKSEARESFAQMLKSQNYHFQVWTFFPRQILEKINLELLNFFQTKEFLLSPIQFGIPNSRLRYFLIAKLETPFSFDTKDEIRNKKKHSFKLHRDSLLFES